MTEPQVWAALGILLAFLTATLTIVTRTISVQIGGLRNEMNARFESVHVELNTRFESVHSEMNTRFEAMNEKFDHRFDTLDRDVQALAARVFRDDRP